VLTSTKLDDRAGKGTDVAHQMLDAPLNYLGLAVRSFDIARGVPRGIDMSRVHAVITCFEIGEEGPDWLLPWLEHEVAGRGLRVVHIGSVSRLHRSGGKQTTARARSWFQRLGLEDDGRLIRDPTSFDLQVLEPELYNYESKPVYERFHVGPRSVSNENRVWVRTVSRRDPNDVRTPIVTGPWGGIALHPWAFALGGADDERRWYIDPFAFFEQALGLTRVPAPAPSVLNGRRVFFLHVDGDGFENKSTVEFGRTCGEVFLDSVVDAYKLPMSISFVIASLTKDLDPATPTPEMLTARRILSRPWVEAASHSIHHPFNWRKPLDSAHKREDILGYPLLPGTTYDPVLEVRNSIRFINKHLVTGNKRCRLMFWSGQANPDARTLAEAAKAGCWNLNGGVFRWDSSYASVGFVSPWGRDVGDGFQVYCGAANENVFEGVFSTMPVAFRHINETIVNTGTDRILKPADVYVHFYSAEQRPRLQAMKAVIERWGFHENTAPIFASDYAAAVHSARTECRVFRTPRGWMFREFGRCRSVRIDAEPRHVDWKRSSGIIGSRRLGRSLYLHLGKPDAELVFADSPVRYPHIEQANHVLTGVELRADGLSFVSSAVGRREVVIAGLTPDTPVLVQLDGSTKIDRSNHDGKLRLVLEEPGITRVEVRMQ